MAGCLGWAYFTRLGAWNHGKSMMSLWQKRTAKNAESAEFFFLVLRVPGGLGGETTFWA
ncbi:MAG: hypothetical protein Fur0016_29600 [Anaerolineales bacterium]